MRSEFEKHYLSLDFYTKGSAQLCLDACSFDEKQDAYLPNMDWILENDADECVTYCCMLNTAYLSFKNQQSKVDELTQLHAKEIFNKEVVANRAAKWIVDLQEKNDELQKRCNELALSQMETASHNAELQKRVDALIKHLDEMGVKSWAVWESSAEMYEQGRADAYWVAKDLLEQALKGGGHEA